jgi:excisionase family DNA binding protein
MPLTLLKPREVADTLRVSMKQVYLLIERGDLSAIRIGTSKGNALRIEQDSLNELIEAGRTDAHS